MTSRFTIPSRFIASRARHDLCRAAGALLLTACSLEGLADGVPDATTTSDATSAYATSGSGGDGGSGGSGGAASSVFTWIEPLSSQKQQQASETYRPAIAPYKDGFVVLFTRVGIDTSFVVTLVRAYRPKASGVGFEMAWENKLVERYGDVTLANVRGKRVLAVAENGDVAIAGTYRKQIELDPEDDGQDHAIFPPFPAGTTDAAAFAGFYVVLRHDDPAKLVADKIDEGRTKAGTIINAAVFDASNDLVLGGAAPKDSLATEPLFPCAGIPATAAVSGFVAKRPKQASCRAVLFTPVASVSEGTMALARENDALYVAGTFGPSSGTTAFGSYALARNGNAGSDVFVAELHPTTLNVVSATSFGRNGSNDTVVDFVVHDGVAWVSGVGGTKKTAPCARATSDSPPKHFLVALEGDACTEALAATPADANQPVIRSVVPFRAPSGEERLWVAGDNIAPNVLCSDLSEQPAARNGYWLEATVGPGGPDPFVVPREGRLFATDGEVYVARTLRLASGAAIVTGSYASRRFDVFPVPELDDFFVAALAPPPALECTPATQP